MLIFVLIYKLQFFQILGELLESQIFVCVRRKPARNKFPKLTTFWLFYTNVHNFPIVQWEKNESRTLSWCPNPYGIRVPLITKKFSKTPET